MAPVLPFLPLITTGLGAITGIMKTIGAHGQGKKEEQAVEAAESARKTALDTVGAPGGNKAPLSNSIGPTGTLGGLGGGQGLGSLGGGQGLGTMTPPANNTSNNGINDKAMTDYLRNSRYGFGKNNSMSGL
jgi:hypothetical protein